jgi:hypothetical protein
MYLNSRNRPNDGYTLHEPFLTKTP